MAISTAAPTRAMRADASATTRATTRAMRVARAPRAARVARAPGAREDARERRHVIVVGAAATTRAVTDGAIGRARRAREERRGASVDVDERAGGARPGWTREGERESATAERARGERARRTRRTGER